jgi:quinol monooxygenase YgiN
MAGSVHIPWYATGFRGDKLEAALNEIAPVALRYGATSYQVFRYVDDRYKFLHTSTFESKADFEAYWHGPEMVRFRAVHSSYYQVPVLYTWADITAAGELPYDPATGGARSSSQAPEGVHDAQTLA